MAKRNSFVANENYAHKTHRRRHNNGMEWNDIICPTNAFDPENELNIAQLRFSHFLSNMPLLVVYFAARIQLIFSCASVCPSFQFDHFFPQCFEVSTEQTVPSKRQRKKM